MLSNVRAFISVEEAVNGRESEIRLIEGMQTSFKAGEIVLKLRIRIKADDPLLCDSEMIVSWKSLVDGTIVWRQNYVVLESGLIQPVINASDVNNSKTVLKSFNDLVKIATFGRYEITLIR